MKKEFGTLVDCSAFATIFPFSDKLQCVMDANCAEQLQRGPALVPEQTIQSFCLRIREILTLSSDYGSQRACSAVEMLVYCFHSFPPLTR